LVENRRWDTRTRWSSNITKRGKITTNEIQRWCFNFIILKINKSHHISSTISFYQQIYHLIYNLISYLISSTISYLTILSHNRWFTHFHFILCILILWPGKSWEFLGKRWLMVDGWLWDRYFDKMIFYILSHYIGIILLICHP